MKHMDKLGLARWGALIAAGSVIWMLGLAVLDVPVDLPIWRHVAGAALAACALGVWFRA